MVRKIRQLSFALEQAHAEKSGVAGAGLGWAKAYDHIDLQGMRRACETVALPSALWELAWQAYGADRRLRVRGLLGEAWPPTAGILPGCAVAVFLLGL